MKVYQVLNVSTEGVATTVGYGGTLAEAQEVVVAQPKADWPNLTVRVGDVLSDRAGMIAALNGEAQFVRGDDSWGVGQRGGLVKDR